MVERNIHITYSEFNSFRELPEHLFSLYQQAIEASKNAYCPYSGFSVGCAVMLSTGEVVLGSNQENSSFPAGTCAERATIFNVRSNFPEAEILAMAISAKSEVTNKITVTPCGICRQVIAEIEELQKNQIEMVMGMDGSLIYYFKSSLDLLPLKFQGDFTR